jgi:hypothetical protein
MVSERGHRVPWCPDKRSWPNISPECGLIPPSSGWSAQPFLGLLSRSARSHPLPDLADDIAFHSDHFVVGLAGSFNYANQIALAVVHQPNR